MEDLVSVFPRYLHESTFPSESMCSPSIYSFHDFCDSNPLVTPLRSSFDREKRKKWSHIEWRCIGFPDLTLVKKVTWFGKSKDFKGKLRYNFSAIILCIDRNIDERFKEAQNRVRIRKLSAEWSSFNTFPSSMEKVSEKEGCAWNISTENMEEARLNERERISRWKLQDTERNTQIFQRNVLQ